MDINKQQKTEKIKANFLTWKKFALFELFIILFALGIIMVNEYNFKQFVSVQPNSVKIDTVATKLPPPGYKILMSNTGEYRWKDPSGYISIFRYNTATRAIEMAHAFEDERSKIWNEVKIILQD